MPKERTININGKNYNEEELSKKAQKIIQILKVTNQEIENIEDILAITKTARSAYIISLEPNLPKVAHANKKKNVISINNKKYSYDDMNEKALSDVISISATDKKISSLQTDLSITKTAKNFYTKALMEEVK